MSGVNYQIQERKDTLLNQVQIRQFLNVKKAAELLGVSRITIYDLINKGDLHAINLSMRKTLVRRQDVDILFHIKAFKIQVKVNTSTLPKAVLTIFFQKGTAINYVEGNYT